ncbi:MAG: GNAT family N-acetyltransferase [Pseudomonadota bacterium]
MDITVYEDAELLHSQWLELEAEAACSIYQRYDWIAQWTAHVGVKAKIRPVFFVGRLGRDTQFIMPMGLHKRGPFHVLSWLGDSHTNFHMGLYAPSFLAKVKPDEFKRLIEALTTSLASSLGRVDVLELCCQPISWQGHTNPFTYLPRQASHNHGFALDLRPSFDEALKRKNGSRKRKKLRWQTNQLKPHGGFTVARAETPSEVDAALDAAFGQMALRFDRAGIWNRFNDPGVEVFMRTLAKASLGSDEPPMVVYSLNIDGGIRATFAGGHLGDQFSGFFISYADDRFSHISPGELIIHQVIKDCAESGTNMFDFGRGQERYKTSWCDVTIPMFDTCIALSRFGLLFTAYDTLKLLAKRSVRNNARLWNLAKSVRRRLYGRI